MPPLARGFEADTLPQAPAPELTVLPGRDGADVQGEGMQHCELHESVSSHREEEAEGLGM